MQDRPTTLLRPRSPAGGAPGNGGPPAEFPPPPAKPRVKKLRVAVVVLGLAMLALVSTVFGMMMAVASDLPQLENKAEYKRAKNSEVFADGRGSPRLARLAGNQNRILLRPDQISPNIKNAVIAIEDRRFWEHEGVDYQGIARALVQDVRRQSAVQGGSTITQQFVKNALVAQSNRSVFQKLREAALAYHLERKWSKQKVLTQYLNSVYFGNGAYGVEAAVRTYFGGQADAVGATHADEVEPAEAALLAGLIASPSRFDPVENRRAATERRDTVLQKMREQRLISEGQYQTAVREPLPPRGAIDPPAPDSREPYFTSWLTQQLVDRYSAQAVFTGGMKVKSTIDLELQEAAEQAIVGRLGGIGPTASLVAIENRTGEVKAMVGGTDFERRPFNLATNGHRQPGSSFKPFILVRALQDGISPETTYTSQPKVFPVPNAKDEKFPVRNYEDDYSGVASLRSATVRSDNSVYAELGLKLGTRRVAELARRMGVHTRVSTNPAMTLGGLKEGVTPLEMAYAYSTIANKGMRVSGTLASPAGPVAIQKVEGAGRDEENEPRRERVFPAPVGEMAQQILAGVVQGGTGKAAQIGEFAAGKTGTTENYGDAWFVGFNKELTVAVWVGYPDRLQYMRTEYGGSPVAGGTFPTAIWHDFMRAWIGMREQRELERGKDEDEVPQLTTPTAPPPASGPAPEQTEAEPEPERPEGRAREPEQREPAPTPRPPATPGQPAQPPAAPAPQGGAPPTGGAGGGAAPG